MKRRARRQGWARRTGHAIERLRRPRRRRRRAQRRLTLRWSALRTASQCERTHAMPLIQLHAFVAQMRWQSEAEGACIGGGNA